MKYKGGVSMTKGKKLRKLFWIFFKAGTFTFAGGLAMLPVIQKELVETCGFLEEEEFIEFASLAQTLPGIIALNCAVLVGKRTAGFLGAAVAGFGSVISAFVLMLAAAAAVSAIPRGGAVEGAFRGVRAASAALILASAFTLARHNLKNTFAYVVALLCFALIIFAGIGAFPVVLAAAAAGVAYSSAQRVRTGKKKDNR